MMDDLERMEVEVDLALTLRSTTFSFPFHHSVLVRLCPDHEVHPVSPVRRDSLVTLVFPVATDDPELLDHPDQSDHPVSLATLVSLDKPVPPESSDLLHQLPKDDPESLDEMDLRDHPVDQERMETMVSQATTERLELRVHPVSLEGTEILALPVLLVFLDLRALATTAHLLVLPLATKSHTFHRTLSTTLLQTLSTVNVQSLCL